MGSKTRIIILQMKEIIYTLVFVVLALLMIFLFIYMFFLRNNTKSSEPASAPTYTPWASIPPPLSWETTRSAFR